MREILAAVLLFLFTRQAAAPPAINFFSASQDIEIGEDSAEQAEKQLPIIRDSHLIQYLRAIAQRLPTALLPRQFHYQVHIVDSNEISSLGFPNGAIYIYSGLLKMASTDDE